MAVKRRASELRPDDMVRYDPGNDEVVDRVENRLADTVVWFVGWSRPVVYHPMDELVLLNSGS